MSPKSDERAPDDFTDHVDRDDLALRYRQPQLRTFKVDRAKLAL